MSFLASGQTKPWADGGFSSGTITITVDGKIYKADSSCSDNSFQINYKQTLMGGDKAELWFNDANRRCNSGVKISFNAKLDDFKGVGKYNMKNTRSGLSLSVDSAAKYNPAINTSWFADDRPETGTATIIITEFTPNKIGGNFSGTLKDSDGSSPRKVSGDFSFVATKKKRDSQEQQILDQNNLASRKAEPNQEGEYLEVNFNGKPLKLGTNCAFFRKEIAFQEALEIFVSEEQCPRVSGVNSFKFNLQIFKYKGKGTYKVSRARAIRGGDANISIGGESEDSYTTEVDAGGMLQVTITNVSGGYIEGTFTGTLLNALDYAKKGSFSGKFKVVAPK